MARSSRSMVACGGDQFAAAKGCDGDLDCAFGKASRVGKRSQTGGHRLPFLSRGLAVKIKVNQISGWPLVVTDQIAHQDVENVVVDAHGLFEARHEEKMRAEGRGLK